MELEEIRNPHTQRLKEIPDPPKNIFTRGNWAKDETVCLAVVGSRALSSYGQQACEKLISGLSGYPISIVSGLALGADACAHKSALSAGLHTIAVLGSGVDDASIYPRAHAGLAREIIEKEGLLLSEHKDGYKARPEDFPKRNRIVVGLSHAVLIIEAGEKSGTLITARLASEYNRDLLCVPHRIGDPHGFGAHLFLRLGAVLVSEPAHILEALSISIKSEDAPRIFNLEGNEKIVFDLLSEPLAKDDLLRTCNLQVGDALSALITLELKGIITESFGLLRRL